MDKHIQDEDSTASSPIIIRDSVEVLERICQYGKCRNKFYVRPSRLAKGGGKYCSVQCHNDARQIECSCLTCQDTFKVKASVVKNGGGKYCCKKCANRGKGLPRITRSCLVCGKKFSTRAAEIEAGRGKYCSLQCWGIFKRAPLIKNSCEACGKEFQLQLSAIEKGRGRYCSLQCKRNKEKSLKQRRCQNEACSKAFISSKARKFCSQKCFQDIQRKKYIKRKCKYKSCHQEFKVTQATLNAGGGHYCSRRCVFLAQDKRVSRKCLGQGCNNTFLVSPSAIRGGKGKYCSRQCVSLRKVTNKRVRCHCQNKECNKTFMIHPSAIKDGRGKHCSLICQRISYSQQHRVECQCQNRQCAKLFFLRQSEINKGRGKYCSRVCYNIARALTPEERKLKDAICSLNKYYYRRNFMQPDEIAQAYVESIINDPCLYCEEVEDIAIDHVIPMNINRLPPGVEAGTNQWWNFAPACRKCNSRKNNWPLTTFLEKQHIWLTKRDGKIKADAWLARMQKRFAWELEMFSQTITV